MRIIGFSTGAIAKADYATALAVLRRHNVHAVELSALRFSELNPLIEALPEIKRDEFKVISFHAPSHFHSDQERFVVSMLDKVAGFEVPIVVHPDTINSPDRWAPLRDWLLIENMDKRKPIGRTAAELSQVFKKLPNARLCFDIGHARQVDPTMGEARRILREFGDRLAEIHLSEVNSSSRHDPLSAYAIEAFQSVASLIPDHVPVILESLIDQGQSDIPTELARARQAFLSDTIPVLASA